MKSNFIFGTLKFIYSISLAFTLLEFIYRNSELTNYNFVGYLISTLFISLLLFYFIISGIREIKYQKPIISFVRIIISIGCILYSIFILGLLLFNYSKIEWSLYQKIDQIITMPLLLFISIRDLFLTKIYSDLTEDKSKRITKKVELSPDDYIIKLLQLKSNVLAENCYSTIDQIYELFFNLSKSSKPFINNIPINKVLNSSDGKNVLIFSRGIGLNNFGISSFILVLYFNENKLLVNISTNSGFLDEQSQKTIFDALLSIIKITDDYTKYMPK